MVEAYEDEFRVCRTHTIHMLPMAWLAFSGIG